jgi:histidine triad (HIT) family protein
LIEIEKLFRVTQRIALQLPSTGIKCEGVNLLFAYREASGQSVFHAHLHVIPRFIGDGYGFKFGPDYNNLPAREALDKIASQIRNSL